MNERVFLSLLFYMPFSPLLNSILPYKIFDFSVWNTIIPFVIMTFYFFKISSKNNPKNIVITLLFLIILTLILILRANTFNLNFLYGLTKSWYLFFPIFIFPFLETLNLNLKHYKIIKSILITHIIFQGTIGMLYFFNLPTIQFLAEDGIEFSRFGGINYAPNVYSNLLFTFYLIYLMLFKNNKIILSILFILTFFGILASGSRLPLFLFLIVNTILGFKIINFKKNKIELTKLAFLLISVFFIMEVLELEKIKQIQNIRLIGTGVSDGLREENNTAAVIGLASSFTSFSIGLTNEQLFENTEHGISDNSFTLITCSYGVFMLFIWMFMFKYLSNYKYLDFKHKKNLLYIIYVLSIFTFNNAILWLPWVYFSMSGYIIIQRKKLINFSRTNKILS